MGSVILLQEKSLPNLTENECKKLKIFFEKYPAINGDMRTLFFERNRNSISCEIVSYLDYYQPL